MRATRVSRCLAWALVPALAFLALTLVAKTATPLPGERAAVEATQEWQAFGDTARFFRDEAHDWNPTVLLALAIIALWRGHPGLAVVIVLLWPARLVNALAKVVIDRARPPAELAIDGTPATNGLPSGHAFAAMTLAIALVLISYRLGGRRSGLIAVVPAAIFFAAAAYSRMWLGVHWPSDVAGGMLLAGCLAAVLLAFEARFEALCAATDRWIRWRKREPRT